MTLTSAVAQNLQGKVRAKSLFQAKAQEQLVVLPDGVSSEDYTMTISQYAYTPDGMVNVGGKRTVQVAFDGQDVYVSGLPLYFRGSYVKGTLNAEGQYVFKNGQFVGQDESGNEYLNGYTYTEEGNQHRHNAHGFHLLAQRYPCHQGGRKRSKGHKELTETRTDEDITLEKTEIADDIAHQSRQEHPATGLSGHTSR